MSGSRSFSFPGAARLLDIDEVGAYLVLTRQAVYQRRARGEFPPAIKVGASLRWRVSDVESWLEAHRDGEASR